MTMEKKQISSLELLKLTTDKGETSYGADQKWFFGPVKQRSGCGPATAANIFYYIDRKKEPEKPPMAFRFFRIFLERMWGIVTPTRHGIPEARMLATRLKNYANLRHYHVDVKSMEIPENPSDRPHISEAFRMLFEAMDNDVPAAFLNLENTSCPDLDTWHWVTVIGIDCDNAGFARVTFLDNGSVKYFDLAHWWTQGKGAGGIVTVIPKNDRRFW